MARIVAWSPVPPVLFQLPETAGGIEHEITATVQETDPITGLPAPVAVTGYRGDLSPEQELIAVAGGTASLIVSAATLAGLFPFDSLEYLQAGDLKQATTWAALPDSAEDLVAYRPSRIAERAYTLTVTATLADGSEESAAYALVILQDWSAGRDRLREEVDARRN